jgi:hypothetical protein
MISPKENYLMMLRGEVPEYVPSFFIPYSDMMLAVPEELEFGSPINAPNGPKYSPWGVKFVGSPENNNGAIPEPGNFILHDITKWRDVIKNPDLSDVDWEGRVRRGLSGMDRETKTINFGGGDYFQTLVSFMGFEEALMAMFEEPEEVYALLDYVSEYNLEVMKNLLYYGKPDTYMLVDDCAAAKSPFFSPEMYRALIKPFHKRHTDLANDAGVLLERHDCGRSEVFIDDWIEMGIRCWNPAQVTNDLKSIKKKYVGKLGIAGAWDNQGYISMPTTPDEELREALYEYVDTFAPGGGFVFMAMATGDREDPVVSRKGKLIYDFYFDYAKDYYKKH